MKKLFTLLTLLVAIVTGAWAQTTTVFSWEGNSEGAIVSGGTVSANNAGTDCTSDDVNIASSTYYVIRLRGAKDFSTNVVVIDLNTALKSGDQIRVTAFRNKDATGKETGVKIKFDNNTTTYGGSTSGTEFVNINSAVSSCAEYATEPNTMTYDVPAVGVGAKKLTLTRYSTGTNLFINKIEVVTSATATSEVLKSSASVKVDDSALTLDAATNGYSIEGTTITLSDDISAYSTPTNIKLVKTITYDNSTTADEDVAVTFDGTVTSGYYIGTTSIGLSGSEISYTVRVKQNLSPVLTTDAATIGITSHKQLGSTKKITLTGTNLTGEASVTWASSVSGLTVTPSTFTVTEGAVDQEFTISYQSNDAIAEATVNLTFAVGETSVVVPVTYSSTAAVALSSISTAKTWNFKKLTSNDVSEGRYGDSGIKLSNETSPSLNDDVTYENYSGKDITIGSGFDGTTLAFKGQYPSRNNTMCQNGTLHFKTSVPGTITVDFSDTGSSVSATAKKRYLNINGTNTIYFTSRPTSGSNKSNDEKTTDPISVEAGDVFITGMEEDGETSIAICVYEIVFTPTPEPATPTTEGEVTYLTTTNKMDGWRAFYDASSGYTLDNNTTAYVATAKNGSTVTMTPLVGGVPSGTPVILKTTSSADNYKMTLTKATVNAYEGTNLLEWTTTAVDSKYRLGYGDKGVGFYPYSGTPASGAVILNTSGGAKALTFVFSDPTGISSVSAKKAVSTGKRYNLSGQLVGEDYKGIVIENGKKFNQ